MILATHQPIFLPWPGLFRKGMTADTLVLLDDVQFPRGGTWMTRNRLKSADGEFYVTVPVLRKHRGLQRIRDVEVCEDTGWRNTHLRCFQHHYAHAPYLREHFPALESIYARGHRRLVDLNVDLIRYLWDALGLAGRLILQSETGVTGNGSDLIVSICRAMNADTYGLLSVSEKYLDPEAFAKAGIRMQRITFQPPVYPQLWGDYRANLSAIDLLLNCGSKAREIL